MRDIAERGRRTANEDAVFATIEEQRRLVDKALSKTRNRRKVAKRPTEPVAVETPPAAAVGEAAAINFAQPAKPYPGEVWDR